MLVLVLRPGPISPVLLLQWTVVNWWTNIHIVMAGETVKLWVLFDTQVVVKRQG